MHIRQQEIRNRARLCTPSKAHALSLLAFSTFRFLVTLFLLECLFIFFLGKPFTTKIESMNNHVLRIILKRI